MHRSSSYPERTCHPVAALLQVALGLTLLAGTNAAAQVFENGPSDSALFTTVINLPPDADIKSDQSSGGVPGETTQVNVADGGSIGDSFEARSGSEVNVNSGTVGRDFEAHSGSEVNILGGRIDFGFRALAGSVLSISGGTAGRQSVFPSSNLITSHGSHVSIRGGSIGISSRAGGVFDISGGSVGPQFQALSRSVVTVTGGSVGGRFSANSGSTVRIAGGAVRGGFTANNGSVVRINGGSLGPGFTNLAGSDVQFSGGEYRLNGLAYSDSSITLNPGDVFAGTLEDGSPFIFNFAAFDRLLDVKLFTASLPAPALTPKLINSPVGDTLNGLRSGQTATLVQGGDIGDDFTVVNASLTLADGSIGSNLEAVDSEINIHSGNVGSNLSALAGTTVNISGGLLNDHFVAHPGSEVNISGGQVGHTIGSGPSMRATGSSVRITGGYVTRGFVADLDSSVSILGGKIGEDFTARNGSDVTFGGGSLGQGFNARDGSRVVINGGSLGQQFSASPGSTVELVGGEFSVNGVEYHEDVITLQHGDIFTGTLMNGSSFVFSHSKRDRLEGVRLARVTLPVRDLSPMTLDDSVPILRSGLRAGQSLTVQNGGALSEDFAVVRAALIVDGGTVGDNVEAVGAIVRVESGVVGARFSAFSDTVVSVVGGKVGDGLSTSGSVLNVSGGSLGDFSSVLSSTMNISGGTVGAKLYVNRSEVAISGGLVGDRFEAGSGSRIKLSGGSIGDRFRADTGSVVTFSGGSIGNLFEALVGSEVHVFGTDFLVDGLPLSGLKPGETLQILDRGVILSGRLADGTPFNFDLNSSNEVGSLDDFFAEGATLTVTLVPEPSGLFVAAAAMAGFAGRGRQRIATLSTPAFSASAPGESFTRR